MNFDDLSDEEKELFLKQSPDTMNSGEMHSDDKSSSDDIQNTPNNSISPDLNGMMSQKSIPSVDSNSGYTSPGEYLQKGMGWYDQNVSNRARAAALAALQGHSPIQAVSDNTPTSGKDISHELFKTLNPQVNADTGATLMKQGEALKDAEPMTGMAAELALDPVNLIPGMGEAKLAESIAPRAIASGTKLAEEAAIPLAERASKPFLTKSGEEATSFGSREAQLDQLKNEVDALKNERDSHAPGSNKYQTLQKQGANANDVYRLKDKKYQNALDKYAKYNALYNKKNQ